MSTITADEKVRFLLSCIKHGQAGGKIDFDAVATELKIASKAAAAKRYERLKKQAFSEKLSADGDDINTSGGRVTTPRKPRKAAAPKTPTSAKRKQAERDDDEEQGTVVDTETPTRKGRANRACTPHAKQQQVPEAEKTAEEAKSDQEHGDTVDRLFDGYVLEVKQEQRDGNEDANGI